MNILINKDLWVLKWKWIYWTIFNILIILLFFKKYTFLSFFFFDVQLNMLGQNQIFSFYILYNFSTLFKNWFLYSFLLFFFGMFNFFFFKLTFKNSFYKIENKYFLWIVLKFLFGLILIQYIYIKAFNWFIYNIKENFVKNFFQIEVFAQNFEITVFYSFFLFVCFYLFFFLYFTSFMGKFYKILIINGFFLCYLLFNLMYLENINDWIFQLLFFFFFRYILVMVNLK